MAMRGTLLGGHAALLQDDDDDYQCSQSPISLARNASGWCFAPLDIRDLASTVQAVVDDQWLWHCPGRQSGKVALAPMAATTGRSMGLHVSILTQLNRSTHLLRLRAACAAVPPQTALTLTVVELFLSYLDRDRVDEEEVWCLGFTFESPAVRAIRDNWFEDDDMHKHDKRGKHIVTHKHDLHLPYAGIGEGQVMLAYVRGECREDVEVAIARLRSSIVGTSVELSQVVFQDENHPHVETIPLFHGHWHRGVDNTAIAVTDGNAAAAAGSTGPASKVAVNAIGAAAPCLIFLDPESVLRTDSMTNNHPDAFHPPGWKDKMTDMELVLSRDGAGAQTIDPHAACTMTAFRDSACGCPPVCAYVFCRRPTVGSVMLLWHRDHDVGAGNTRALSQRRDCAHQRVA